MELKKRMNAFIQLGEIITCFLSNTKNNILADKYAEKLRQAIAKSHYQNGWFTEENVRKALFSISLMLEKEKMEQWLTAYEHQFISNKGNKKVGVIMAGNIPLVGFHDMLCVLISENIFVGKLSSSDSILISLLAEILIEINADFKDKIVFTDNRLPAIDAVIATGSNNSSRYFDYYFKKYPHIIRKNRTSVAVLNGAENANDLALLGEDVFSYFGLGCRNVSKLFFPKDYNVNLLYEAFYSFNSVINNHKYANNYDYNKTIYLMRQDIFLDNNFLILKEDKSFASPVAVLFFEYYSDEKSLNEKLIFEKENIQCCLSAEKNKFSTLKFGTSQQPELWDYADGVDTLKFLLSDDFVR
ncbi:MAG TPA: acyl-CoA reductase [Bacteroidia bacterium]|nr:acyl-CoA reductase [Bacteroidia bacterium]